MHVTFNPSRISIPPMLKACIEARNVGLLAECAKLKGTAPFSEWLASRGIVFEGSEIKDHFPSEIIGEFIVEVPFSGFYNSTHGQNLDYAVTLECSADEDGDDNPEKEGFISGKVNFSKFYTDYAKAYVDNFSTLTGLKVEFLHIKSPKEYNFETDKIICKMYMREKDKDLLLSTPILREVLTESKKALRPRDGFIPFYSTSPREWGDVEKMPPALWGIVLQAVANVKSDYQFEEWENSSMENYEENGYFSEWLWGCTGWAKAWAEWESSHA